MCVRAAAVHWRNPRNNSTYDLDLPEGNRAGQRSCAEAEGEPRLWMLWWRYGQLPWVLGRAIRNLERYNDSSGSSWSDFGGWSTLDACKMHVSLSSQLAGGHVRKVMIPIG